MRSSLKAALEPRSVAIVGASDNPHKVGGRPLMFLKRYGYKGAIYPINPGRKTVQDLAAYPSIESLPGPADLAVVAVAGDEAVRAVEACAARGVKVAVVMTSGFGETGEQGLAKQNQMLSAATAAGMRLIGPNCQGLANFANGMVANFGTIFLELEGRDGPVAIVSQSGASSQVIYQLVREKGLGVRHLCTTGNEADVSVAELAGAVLADRDVKLILLYMEAVKHPRALAEVAEEARRRGVPIVAMKAGRTASGRRAAQSHTGALASEDRVVDAFFERHAIWRADDAQELVAAAELYVSGRRPRGRRLVFVSNSGASCVMAADHADMRGIPLAEAPKEKLKTVLPGFAALDNPVDVTGALLGNSKLIGQVLPLVSDTDLLVLALPVAGTGYDVPGFARDLGEFQSSHPVACALAAPQASVRAPFTDAGVATFSREKEAMDALAQLAAHSALLRRKPAAPIQVIPVAEKTRFLNEAESLALIAGAGLPVIEHRLCKHEDEVLAACKAIDGPWVLKACSRDLPHKSDVGLVSLDAADPVAEFARLRRRVGELGAWFDGVIVARKASRARELALGARLDAHYGPVVLVGDGGIYLEALQDFRLLLPPFGEADVLAKLDELRVAPMLKSIRGQPARDVGAFARMALRLGEAMLEWNGRIVSLDINPVMVFETGAAAVDALAEAIISE